MKMTRSSSHIKSSTFREGLPPAASLLVEEGIPGIQYCMVDPDLQYQKFLIVVVQALSGVDPSSPPSYSPTLSECGEFLEIRVPVSSVVLDDRLLVHPQAAWMKEGSAYSSDRTARLAGIGPAIAELKTYYRSEELVMTRSIPLSSRCSELCGNYSISNFAAPKSTSGKKYRPVFVKFKLRLEEQAVKKRAAIKVSYIESSGDESDSEHSGRASRRRKIVDSQKY